MTDGLGLGDAYGATLQRIKAQGGQKSELGMAALMWISHSERPLRAEELCHALAVEIESTDYNVNNVSSIRTVLSCCQGLVVVDKEGSAVRLVHFTLQEYLTSRPDLFRSPHAAISETCLTYLNSPQVMALSASASLSAQHTPFLEYPAIYWGAHMKKEPTDRGKVLALKLFSHYEPHISIKLLLEHTLRYSISSFLDSYKFTGLHCACMFGLVEVTRALIETDGVDINRVDNTGATPISWAASRGHEAVVELLLEREDINPSKADSNRPTPLSWAAENGNEAVVKLLLGREDASPERLDWFGRTAFWYAAKNGHEGVVRLLLGREDVNPDMPDNFGRAPVSCAAECGHDAVVELLLAYGDVNTNRLDNNGQTPISWAASSGQEGVVKLLLAREDVNPDRPDNDGRIPISHAARNGQERVVKLLLAREDVNPDRLDDFGRTAISLAAEHGRRTVVKLLLERGDVNPDRRDDEWSRAPILWAAENGHVEVVKMFLERDDVNSNKPDICGFTVSSYVDIGNGHPVARPRRDPQAPLTPPAYS